jgi:Protein of unknown function (DUF2867)
MPGPVVRSAPRMARPHPLDPTDHLGRPWRVHALARAEGLALHDVWEVDAALPPGATLGQWADAWRRERQSAATRALFAVRWGLGRLLSLDRGSPGFTLLYAEAEEQLHRIDNRTVSAFLHLSLVGRRPRLAVHARPHGRLGRWYLRGIDPFRRAIIYPSLLAAGRRAVQRLAG